MDVFNVITNNEELFIGKHWYLKKFIIMRLLSMHLHLDDWKLSK